MPLWYLFFTAGHLDLGKVSCTSFFAHLFPGIPADFKSVGAVVLEFGSVVIRLKNETVSLDSSVQLYKVLTLKFFFWIEFVLIKF